MSLTRTASSILSLVPVLTGLASAACGTVSEPVAEFTTDSALVVSPSEDGKTVTLSADNGACASPADIIGAKRDSLSTLCKDGQLPVPGEVVSTGCSDGQVKSITFKCVVAKAPPVPAQGCRKIEVKDDSHAICSGGAAVLSALPPILCPRLGAAPPPPPTPAGPHPAPGPVPGAQGGSDAPQPPLPLPTPLPMPPVPGPGNGSGDIPSAGPLPPSPGPLPAAPMPGPGGGGSSKEQGTCGCDAPAPPPPPPPPPPPVAPLIECCAPDVSGTAPSEGETDSAEE